MASNIHETARAQQLIQELQNNNTPKSGGISATQPQCPQCGTFHPPIPQGQECPLKPKKDETGQEIKPETFLRKMHGILVSQMEQKSIKDHQKFYNYLTIELTKAMERYKEENEQTTSEP